MLETEARTSTEGVQKYIAKIKAVAVQWWKNDEAKVDNKKQLTETLTGRILLETVFLHVYSLKLLKNQYYFNC